jgi:hypothetical protein
MAGKKKAEDQVSVPSRREDLVMMRERLVLALVDAESSVVAQIVGQLRAVVKELDELPEVRVESQVDRAARLRAERRQKLRAV